MARAKLDAFPRPSINDPPLGWYVEEPPTSYRPYLVEATRHGRTLSFRFLDLDTGMPTGQQHTVNLDDASKVRGDHPSTAQKVNGTNTCGFLFLTDSYVANMSEAIETGGGQGKWPAGAGWAETARAAIDKVLAAPELLDGEERAALALLRPPGDGER